MSAGSNYNLPPMQAERRKCWHNRDEFWDCLDKNGGKVDLEAAEKKCQKQRLAYEQACPLQWVKHFDRRYNFNTFKELLEKEGYTAGPDPEKLKGK